jgi:ribonuclease D
MTPASKQQIAQAMRLDVRANSVTHRLQFAKVLAIMPRLQAHNKSVQYPISDRDHRQFRSTSRSVSERSPSCARALISWQLAAARRRGAAAGAVVRDCSSA